MLAKHAHAHDLELTALTQSDRGLEDDCHEPDHLAI